MQRWLTFSLAAALVATTVCGTQPAQAGAPDVVIGAILPLTGSLAPTGNRLRNAIQMAADIVNGNQSVHYPLPMTGQNGFPNLGHAKLKVIFGDSQGKPDQAKTVAEEMITQDHVVGIIGCYASGVTATASQVAERYGVPFLNPDSSSPDLIKRGFKWFFRTTPDDETFSQNFFDFLGDLKKTVKVQPKKVAIGYEDTLFGKPAATYEAADAKAAGYDVVASIAFPQGTSEVNAEVQRIKAAAPDVIIMNAQIGDAILFTKTFKEQGVVAQGTLAQDAGYVDPSFVKTLGPDADFILSREVWSLNSKLKNPGVGLVNDLFQARYGSNMDGNVARDFMGTLVLADAINRAKSTAPEAVRAALAATDIPGDRTIMPWKGIKFDSRGQNVLGSGIIVQIIGGKYLCVWPSQFAVHAPVWPIPGWK